MDWLNDYTLGLPSLYPARWARATPPRTRVCPTSLGGISYEGRMSPPLVDGVCVLALYEVISAFCARVKRSWGQTLNNVIVQHNRSGG